MKIIAATKADIPSINELVHTCYRGQESFQGWTSEANILNGNRTTPEVLSKDMEDPSVTILKCLDSSGNLVACCLAQAQKDGKIHTGMLSVRPNLQGSGIGKKMMSSVEDLGREKNCTKMKIQVISYRTELVAWYERQGFKANGKSIPFPPPTPDFGIPKENLELVLIEMEKPIMPSPSIN